MDGVWEGVARDVLEATGADEPAQDAFELAALFGLEIVWSRHVGHADGDRIALCPTLSPARAQGVLSHELGHWCLRRAGEDDSEIGASYIGGALMLPRRVYDLDLRETWDLDELSRRHPNCSYEMLARRLCQLREASGLVVDNGRVRARFGLPWAAGERREWHLRRGAWRRVIVVRSA